MKLTKNEEDYLKTLFHLTIENAQEKTGTNKLAEHLSVSPASVNAMLKKLKVKELVDYKKYGKLQLTEQGKDIAIQLLRKHRLWETFLYQHMNFKWEEVHEVAEQLEHIQSEKLIEELDKFLGYPQRDPHGAIIPNTKGEYLDVNKMTLAEVQEGKKCRLISVKDESRVFLKFVSKIGLSLNSEILVKEVQEFDSSLIIAFAEKEETVTHKFATHVFVEEL